MLKTGRLLVFTLSGQCYALHLSNVQRVIRAVEIKPLPDAPDIVTGLINVQGRIIPALNIRKLLRLPDVDISLNDRMILAHTASRSVAILVNDVTGVADCGEQDVVTSDELFPGIEYLEGVVKLKDGIVYIYDLERFC